MGTKSNFDFAVMLLSSLFFLGVAVFGKKLGTRHGGAYVMQTRHRILFLAAGLIILSVAIAGLLGLSIRKGL
jgi:hypothetical protein